MINGARRCFCLCCLVWLALLLAAGSTNGPHLRACDTDGEHTRAELSLRWARWEGSWKQGRKRMRIQSKRARGSRALLGLARQLENIVQCNDADWLQLVDHVCAMHARGNDLEEHLLHGSGGSYDHQSTSLHNRRRSSIICVTLHSHCLPRTTRRASLA